MAEVTYRMTSELGPGFVYVDLNHRCPVLHTNRFLYYRQYVTQSSDEFANIGARVGECWERVPAALFGNNLANKN